MAVTLHGSTSTIFASWPARANAYGLFGTDSFDLSRFLEEGKIMNKRLLIVLMVMAMIVAALPVNVGAQEGEGPAQVGLRPDAPPYALHGPYAVGTMELMIEDAERPLPVTVWYPAADDILEGPHTYMVEMPPVAITGHAIPDAFPDLDHGPYPLVVFSHGIFLYRLQSVYLTEHLASYGFVVLALDHPGETLADQGAPSYPGFVLRPSDITRVITFAEQLTKGEGALSGLIDTERVAVAGHSQGDLPALMLGGASLNLAALQDWCDENNQSGAFTFCGELLEHAQDMATLAGLEDVPERSWPSVKDPRVDAIVTMAAVPVPMYGNEDLAEIDVPLMAMVGSADWVWPPGINLYRGYEAAGSSQKALVVFENAGHMLFANDCQSAPFFVDLGFFMGCSDAVWDMDRAHDLINHFTTAFLLAELYDDADAAAALAPDAVSFPGITYETTGF
jgi:predicted dienelactone hydrolase